MPARAFVDSDVGHGGDDLAAGFESKCPQGHLLILIEGNQP